ncbi:MAG: HEAT repeat domain-containing protein [Anaerolineae bacterium]|nr:HEAT repeat domain-containing protein [Gemmatimonadaceae bacterium]
MDRARGAGLVTAEFFLAFFAVSEGLVVVLIVVLLIANRLRQKIRAQRASGAASSVAEPMRRWLVGMASANEVAVALRLVDPETALDELLRVVASRVPSTQLDELALVLHEEAWVRDVMEREHSRLWWRRLDAARILSVIGGAEDRDRLRRLLADRHPAVQSAATSALGRVADAGIIALVLDEIPRKSFVVRFYQIHALRDLWHLTIPALVERLQPAAQPRMLEAWVNLAEAIADPACLARVLPLASHGSAEVRLAAARALKKYFHTDTIPALQALMADTDWRVRGQAARGLGALSARDAIPQLSEALGDRIWWVRFRSGLALAQLGEPGRKALREAREMDDRYGRDMAAMISGLSEGGIVELAEA